MSDTTDSREITPVDNAYAEATDCPICPMLATDRDDALREVEHLRSSLWAEIVAERERAHRKHGDTSMESCDPMADRRLRVLTEEVGEVARVLNDREHDIAKGEYLAEERAQMYLREELIQVAAMAVAWIAALDGEALA